MRFLLENLMEVITITEYLGIDMYSKYSFFKMHLKVTMLKPFKINEGKDVSSNLNSILQQKVYLAFVKLRICFIKQNPNK